MTVAAEVDEQGLNTDKTAQVGWLAISSYVCEMEHLEVTLPARSSTRSDLSPCQSNVTFDQRWFDVNSFDSDVLLQMPTKESCLRLCL